LTSRCSWVISPQGRTPSCLAIRENDTAKTTGTIFSLDVGDGVHWLLLFERRRENKEEDDLAPKKRKRTGA
jgi:hypothetical protein